MKRNLLYFVLLVLWFNTTKAQNTIGTVTIDESVTDGYTLFTIDKNTYLIDNCGQVVNSWTSTFRPGNAVYLLGDGSILRAGQTDTTDIILGGRGGVIERYDWDGNLTWQYFYDTPTERQHHDIFPMPNGNVLILAATIMTDTEAIEAGRNPANLSSSQLYNEQIIEVTPIGISGATIVWEWNINDHFVQDFDATKDNFGNVSESPELLDINYISSSSTAANWLHFNSIQYDEQLDQIVISSRNMSEIYIIDHSTTTAEAASGNGGIYGKGGDLLYRWGNPEAYQRGTAADRQLYGQHFPHYIRNSVNDNGKIIVFNNGNGRPASLFSEVYVIDPPISSPGNYSIGSSAFGPSAPDYNYTDPVPTDFYSSIISGAQRLSNGNTLIMEGTKGRIFEINQSEEILWEYYIPVNAGTGVAQNQGDDPSSFANGSFRATKYLPNYSAFTGRDLSTPNPPIENNPNINSCLNTLNNTDFETAQLKLFPNPVVRELTVSNTNPIEKLTLLNINGAKVLENYNSNKINVESLKQGVYFLNIHVNGTYTSRKIIKQ